MNVHSGAYTELRKPAGCHGSMMPERAAAPSSRPRRSAWLLISGADSTSHLRENLAAEHVALDDQALRELADVGAGPS
jgi:aryl-alcohol dehydrogenase-like predicted oxidoreductase